MNQNDNGGKNPDFKSIIYANVFVLAKYWNVIDKTVEQTHFSMELLNRNK